MPPTDATDRSAAPVTTVKPFQIRGRFFTAVSLRLGETPPDDTFWAALDEQLRQTPQFFNDAPLILDLEQAAALSETAAITALIAELRKRRLAAFGVQNATPGQVAAAAESGLIAITSGSDAPLRTGGHNAARAAAKKSEWAEKRAEKTDEKAEDKADEPGFQPGSETLVITHPVRSGQTVFAERGDLVVIGPVSSGAELIATGNIHVYGHLRGRALAGVKGDENARIFCQNLDAELLAIAGLYRTSDNLESDLRRRSVQVFLRDQRLCVEAL